MFFLPEQDSPDPWYPALQTQSYELYELMHLACAWHILGVSHSFISKRMNQVFSLKFENHKEITTKLRL